MQSHIILQSLSEMTTNTMEPMEEQLADAQQTRDQPMAAVAKKVVLIAGDSRVNGLKDDGEGDWLCHFLSMPGKETLAILEATDEYLKSHPEVEVVVIVALHCDLTEQRRYLALLQDPVLVEAAQARLREAARRAEYARHIDFLDGETA